MKKLVPALAAGLALLVMNPVDAQANPQHERMKRCNAEAKEQALKGDERKAFMSTCLKGKHDPAAVAGQQAAAPASAGQPIKAATVPSPTAGNEAAAKGATAGKGSQVAQAGAPADKSDKTKACNQAAVEQSLSGAKRKAFVADCVKG
ncbi:PsiF repeat-containing protein [Thauera propionica]|uniref:PsiF repeat-containing protein n=1 Tax=Thauera propionica TaxID=2019431 RepID=A0A235F2W3_9RHOO|nr:PsiF family protein [Thauera propionica]OYD55227.1 PsiF repeat-containing protein [Thauera propionica]